MKPLPPIEQLVPHRAPSLFLDEVLEEDDDSVRCRGTIGAGSPFLRDGAIDGVVLIELMAQAVAAYAGLSALRSGTEPRVGFLIGCRDAAIHCERLAVGAQVVVEARREWGQYEVGNFRCCVLRAGEVLAEAALTVAYGDQPG